MSRRVNDLLTFFFFGRLEYFLILVNKLKKKTLPSPQSPFLCQESETKAESNIKYDNIRSSTNNIFICHQNNVLPGKLSLADRRKSGDGREQINFVFSV
jgi:hypothetical protein